MSPNLPERLFCKVKFCETFTMDTGNAGAINSYVFRGNSIYDPTYTNVGTTNVP